MDESFLVQMTRRICKKFVLITYLLGIFLMFFFIFDYLILTNFLTKQISALYQILSIQLKTKFF